MQRGRRRITVAAPSVVAPDAPTLTAPADNADVYDGVPVTVSATVTAGQVPDRIDFVLDPGGGEVVVATDSSSPYSQSWAPSGVAPGAHTLVARFVYGSGSVDSAAIDIVVWAEVAVSSPSDLSTVAWAALNLSARTADTLTDTLDGGPLAHNVKQTVAAATIGKVTRLRVSVPAATGVGRYVGVVPDGGWIAAVIVDAQTETIQVTPGGVTNATYAGGVLAFDYTMANSKEIWISTSTIATTTYQGAGTGTARVTLVRMHQEP